jgi:hypothetical protein
MQIDDYSMTLTTRVHIVALAQFRTSGEQETGDYGITVGSESICVVIGRQARDT